MVDRANLGTQVLPSLWPWLLKWQVLFALVLLVRAGLQNLIFSHGFSPDPPPPGEGGGTVGLVFDPALL